MTTLQKFDDELDKSLKKFSRGVLLSISLGFLATKLTKFRIFFLLGCISSPLVGLRQTAYTYNPSDFYSKPSTILEREILKQNLIKLRLIPTFNCALRHKSESDYQTSKHMLDSIIKLGF